MLIQSIKSDFNRVSEAVGGNFTSLAIDELQVFSQSYEFDVPVINMYPIQNIASEMNESGRVIWDVSIMMDFLQIAEVNSTENEKDVIIDQMIDLSVLFIRKLHKNENRVFENPVITMRNSALRFKTSQYCVGVGFDFNVRTSCNRI